MALLAEELVEEWLNRAGFFTMRGVRIGVHEMDLLAIRPSANGLECRHIEVQASVNPVSYLFRLTRADQEATGRAATSSGTRSEEQISRGADEWVHKKFEHPQKLKLLSSLAPGPWSREVVLHRLRHPEELAFLKAKKVIIHRLSDVVLLGSKGHSAELESETYPEWFNSGPGE
jgi:hypothetical protein